MSERVGGRDALERGLIGVAEGPPDAVRIKRRTSRWLRPSRHWWMALCSLSTGGCRRVVRGPPRPSRRQPSPALPCSQARAFALPRWPRARPSSPAVPDEAQENDVDVGIGCGRDESISAGRQDGHGHAFDALPKLARPQASRRRAVRPRTAQSVRRGGQRFRPRRASRREADEGVPPRPTEHSGRSSRVEPSMASRRDVRTVCFLL